MFRRKTDQPSIDVSRLSSLIAAGVEIAGDVVITDGVRIDGQVVGAGELAAGKVDIVLPTFTTVGTRSVELRYFGDDTTKPATATTRAVCCWRCWRGWRYGTWWFSSGCGGQGRIARWRKRR